ncbi:MAG: hypothetical protein U5Q03_17440 [Bacteroidota bacterium]|nr:hypothetical protein [Bacteroidota bacterium]
MIKEGHAYSGGEGENGYFGFVDDFLRSQEIEEMAINTIPQLIKKL